MAYKTSLYTIICVLLMFSGYAQNKKQVLLALNPDECSACFGGLKNLQSIDTYLVAVTAVFKKKYRMDSAALIKSLYLDQYALNYAFSDSLYELFIIDKSQSSLVVCEKGKAQRPYLLKTMSDEMILSSLSDKPGFPISNDYGYPGSTMAAARFVPSDRDRVSGLPQRADTFRFAEVVFKPGVDNFIVNKGQLYTLNANFNRIQAYDLNNRKLIYSFDISKELMLKVYRKKFGEQWPEANIDFMRQNKIVKIADITDFQINNIGDIYLMLHLQYLIANKDTKDTFLTVFPALISLKNGAPDKILPINLKDIGGYFLTCRWFNIYKDKMYTNAVKKQFSAQGDNKFIGTLSYRDSQFYAGDTLHYNLPDIYSQYHYNFTSLVYWKNYASLKTTDKFFCLDSNELIAVNHFPEKNYQDDDIYNVKYGLLHFRIDDGYVCYTYWDQEKKSVCYLKFNRKKKTVVYDREVFHYEDTDITRDCIIDDNDCHKVYFALDPFTLVAKQIE